MERDLDVVTGGAGFIGSHLSRALLRSGRRVRVLDNLATGSRERVEPLLEEFGGRCEFLEADIRDLETCRDAFEGAEVVYHQAAVPSVPRSVKDPLTSNAANVDGTLNVLVAARDRGVAKVVYASSSSVYGNSDVLPKHEGLPLNPASPYAVTKCAGELYGRVFADLWSLPTVGLRYFNVFGPSQDPASQYAAVIPRFVTALLKGEPPTIYGDGEQSRDFTYIDNVVQANRRAAESPASGISANVACGDRFTLKHLVATLNEILGTRIDPVHAEPRPGDVRHSQADISLARRSFGFEPSVGFEEGLRRTVAWFRER
jgi:nucleoside-diphosphate-sugar epimerase